MSCDESLLVTELKRIARSGKQYRYEFVFTDWETDFLRFYASQPNYNISKRSVFLTVTVEREKRKSTFRVTDPSLESVAERIDEAKSSLDVLPSDPHFTDFETDRGVYRYKDFPDSVTSVPLEWKLDIVKRLSGAVESHGFGLYGTFITQKVRKRIVNSNGLDKLFYHSPVMLETKAVSRANMATVLESFGGANLGSFDEAGFAESLAAKIHNAQLPVTDVEPGNYEVILGPHALQEFLEYFLIDAEGRTLDTGESFFEGKVGQKILPESVTVLSDPAREGLVPYPYNSDGHLAGRLPIIEKGVFRNFILDKYYADKLKMKNNGSVGSRALVFEKGNTPLESMIGGMKRGLYISTIHYMNFINIKETSVTGLTRDGTFLVENGRIVNLVNNLRYTVKISDILENITAVGDRLYPVPRSDNYFEFHLSCGLVPHVRSSKFAISSTTGTI